MILCQRESWKFWVSTNIDQQRLKWFHSYELTVWYLRGQTTKSGILSNIPSLRTKISCKVCPKKHSKVKMYAFKWTNFNIIRNSTVLDKHASLTNLSAASGNVLLPWALKRRSWQSSVNWMLVFRSSEIKSSFLIGALMSFAVNGG